MLISLNPIGNRKNPEIKKDIETVNQLIECIRNGYAPCISYEEMTSYLFEMMYNLIDNSDKYQYRDLLGIIHAIQTYYINTKDFYEWQAIMIFKNFLNTGTLDFKKSLNSGYDTTSKPPRGDITEPG